jgi:hypothetical protein
MNKSAREYATAYVNAKTATTRKKLTAEVLARADVSKRKRWANLAKAMADGDLARVAAYAAEGEAKREAWAAVRAANAPAKPKASAKPKRKSASKPKADAPKADPNALVAQLAGLDDVAFAAFFDALVKARQA